MARTEKVKVSARSSRLARGVRHTHTYTHSTGLFFDLSKIGKLQEHEPERESLRHGATNKRTGDRTISNTASRRFSIPAGFRIRSAKVAVFFFPRETGRCNGDLTSRVDPTQRAALALFQDPAVLIQRRREREKDKENRGKKCADCNGNYSGLRKTLKRGELQHADDDESAPLFARRANTGATERARARARESLCRKTETSMPGTECVSLHLPQS